MYANSPNNFFAASLYVLPASLSLEKHPKYRRCPWYRIDAYHFPDDFLRYTPWYFDVLNLKLRIRLRQFSEAVHTLRFRRLLSRELRFLWSTCNPACTGTISLCRYITRLPSPSAFKRFRITYLVPKYHLNVRSRSKSSLSMIATFSVFLNGKRFIVK
jgi:hypothetical protein